MNAVNIHLYVNSWGVTLETDLADKVGHVEGGHDEDGQPLPEGVVPYLRLQAGEETQGDAVGDGDGEHVGPDHTGDHVAMQDHVCRGRQDDHTYSINTNRTENSHLQEPYKPFYHCGVNSQCAPYKTRALRKFSVLPRRPGQLFLILALGASNLTYIPPVTSSRPSSVDGASAPPLPWMSKVLQQKRHLVSLVEGAVVGGAS